MPLLTQYLTQAFRFMQHPLMHRLNESIARNEIQFARKDAKEHISVGRCMRHARFFHLTREYQSPFLTNSLRPDSSGPRSKERSRVTRIQSIRIRPSNPSE